ncbi:adenylate/guanylate cyclase domain-containing protein [Parvibaculum sp.]|uniref:CHASE2 domain-containing protein n=1 Tax=Parvibaculum sp. TaxID=2024848 RepID=UPI001B0A74AC|nr:adenylate/guanylate cyclase domain-containing protein [Parvibaculum sp.]MBO6634090.1 adenylate/guanylate cyclase domain-containing protein [Parvibaculum sp.]MBO6679838.1 adenylate/guanylate cyclase domain-containing protein [Parvibaculum sp.]MBO6683801.1 adenylate/guanylate cyclase domain-containing protein [Parvibaculum sp.]MBO6905910.1 adenylate/guanylate cyclase domain-containing protein [Parvibaculum sp.]
MNPTPAFRRLSAILPGLVLVLALAVSIYNPRGMGTFLQDQVFDVYQRILPREPGPLGTNAVYVDIDAETAKAYGAWPWPRKRLDDLVERVRDAGASAIVIDMPLAEPDPTSANELIRLWSPFPANGNFAGLGQALSQLPNHERELTALLASTNSVVSFVPGKTDYSGKHEPARAAAIDPEGGDPRHYMTSQDTWRPTLKIFEAAAKGNGATLPAGARDTTIRGVPMLLDLDGALYPSNVLEALRVSAGGTGYRAQVTAPESGFSFEIEPGIERVAIDGTPFAARTWKNGELRLYFGGEETRRRIPAGRILAGTANLEPLNERIAVIGVSANGSDRLYMTPAGIRMPSGAIAANAIDQIANGQFLLRPGWVPAAEQVFILVAGVIVILVVRRFRSRWGLALTLLLAGGAGYGSWWAFETYRWLIDPALGSVTLLAAAATCALMTRLHTEDEIRFVETQFGRRLPSAGLAKVKANPRMIHGEGQLRDVTSVVAGLRGFNIISDRYLEDPTAYADILNRFFSPMTKIVLDRNGMVDRTVGDALYAVWNAPLDAGDHASKGCDAALRMVENLEALNEFLEEDARRQHLSHVPLSLSIGIDTGTAIAGNMGAVQRFDYGVLGEPVSFAAYLQKNARHYGPAIIVGEGTQRAVGDRYALLEIDLVSTPRHPEGRRVYALLGDPIMRANPKFRALQEAHTLIFSAYRNQRWAEARAAIAECRKLNGAIPTLYDFYEARIEQYEANPPGEHWNGAWFAGRI